MSAYPRIGIVGAGPAGLTLARILHLAGIPCTVYELDPSKEDRYEQGKVTSYIKKLDNKSLCYPGGSLDLHEESGLAAIQAANLTSQLSKILRPEAEAMCITDHTSVILYHDSPDSSQPGSYQGTRPEVDRTLLRSLLLDSIPQHTVRWGHKVNHAKQAVDGTYSLVFENQPEVTGFHILIGSDGAWSKIRPLISDTKPYYSGVSTIELRHRDISNRSPVLSTLVGAGTLFALHDSKVLCCQRNGDDSIRVYAMQPTDESWLSTCGIDWKGDPKKAMVELKDRYYPDWDDKLQDLITKADEDTLMPRTLYMLPIGFSWPQRNGVTIIGDAAHLMTPFAGEGVNLAMWDAMLLGRALVDALKDGWDKDNVWTAMRVFEEEMFIRAKEKAQESWDNMQIMVQSDAAKAMVAMFEMMMAQGGPATEG